jgi:hypothetical protein
MEGPSDSLHVKPNLHYTAGSLLQNPLVHQIRLRHEFSSRHHSNIQHQIFRHLYRNFGVILFCRRTDAVYPPRYDA